MNITQQIFTPSFQGWSPENKYNKKQIEKMKNVIENSSINSVAISGHNNPDGDSIGACFAMAYLMNKKLDKPVDVYIFGTLPQKFEHLRNDKINVININNENPIKFQKNYDLAVSLDTAETHLMNPDYYKNIYKNADNRFKIDHHKKDANYADVNLVDSDSPSAAELVMQLVEPMGINPRELPQEFNKAVYTGIVTDSKNFTFASNPLPFKDSALLVENGLKPAQALKHIHTKVPKPVYDIVNLARNKVKYTDDNKIAYLYVDENLNKEIEKLDNKDLQYEAQYRMKDMVNYLRDIEGVEISLMISDRKNNLYVSGRSSNMNIRNLAERFGGGGHDKAASFSIVKGDDVDTTINRVLKAYQKELKDNNY